MNRVENPYTATFTMKQHGLDGGIEVDLVFDPKIEVDQEVAPAIYEFMSRIVLNFVAQIEAMQAGLVTDDADELHNVLTLDLSNSDRTIN